eukprot:m.267448 g.267448  ORF g.267448 m.267448 type:complete len:199 (-) comp16247_c0_seq13:192-788(-)
MILLSVLLIGCPQSYPLLAFHCTLVKLYFSTHTHNSRVCRPADPGNMIHGHDISPLFTFTNDTQRKLIPRPVDKPLFWEWRFAVAGPCWNDAPQLAMRQGNYKLLINPDASRVELYDLSPNSSFWEGDNIAPLYPDMVSNMTAQLMKWHSTLPPGPVDDHFGCANIGWPTPGNMQAAPSQSGADEDKMIWEDDGMFIL